MRKGEGGTVKIFCTAALHTSKRPGGGRKHRRPVAAINAAAIAITLAIMASCQYTPPRVDTLSPAPEVLLAMAELPVVSFVIPIGETSTARRSGSAIVLDDHRLVFTLHQVDEQNDVIRFSSEYATRYEVLASGNGTSDLFHQTGPTSEDWALVEIDKPIPTRYIPAYIDWERKVETGEPVYLVGFPFAPAIRDDGEMVRLIVPYLERSVIPGRAALRPAHSKAPRNMLYVHRPAFDGTGLSGGAAAVWDETLNAPVIIGIIAGRLEVIQGSNETTLAMVVRPPIPSRRASFTRRD